jgi:hypothetical protein
MWNRWKLGLSPASYAPNHVTNKQAEKEEILATSQDPVLTQVRQPFRKPMTRMIKSKKTANGR